MIVILDYICAIFLTQCIGRQAALWGHQEAQIQEWFGNIGRSMRTLSFIMTLAEWDTIVLTVSEQVNGFVVLFCAMSYILMTAYTMLSLITGVICEALVTAKNEDEQKRIAEIEEGHKAFANGLKELFLDLDEDG